MKATILFICSSRRARVETLSLKIQDYIDALSKYLPRKDMDIFEIIDLIEDDDTVVPTFNIRRKKTNKYYTTYCSPEAVKAINAHIRSRTDNVTNDSKLFKIVVSYFSVNFQKINENLGLGKVGNYNRFRSHMLRKFHASALYNDGMSLDDVNDLQGKSKNRTDQAYFMINPEDLKYEYIGHLPAVTISAEVKNFMSNHRNLLKSKMRKTNLKVNWTASELTLTVLKVLLGNKHFPNPFYI